MKSAEGTLGFLSNRRLWLLCAVIFVSRLVLLLVAQWLPGDDGLRYLQEALNLRDFNVFSSDKLTPPGPTTFDLPIFPFLFSVVLRLVPDLPTATRLTSAMNAVFFTAACAWLYGISRALSDSDRFGVLTVVLFVCFPETWPYSIFYMPDSLFLFVFLGSVFLLVSFLKAGGLWKLLSAFFFLAVSTLIKPVSLYFGLIFGVLCLLFWPVKETLGRRVAWVACGFVIELCVFCPWIVRNQVAFGHPVLTTITEINYFRENYRMLLEDTHPGEAKEILQAQEDAAREKAGQAWSNPVEQAKFLGQIAGRELKSNFSAYLKTTAKRHPRLYLGTGSVALLRMLGDERDTSALEQWQSHPSLAGAKQVPARALFLQLAAWFVLCLAYAASFVGAINLFRRKAWLQLAVTLLPLLYLAAAVGPMTYTRYRMPMAPFLAILAAFGVYSIKARSQFITGTSIRPDTP